MRDELLFDDNFFVSKSIKHIDSSVGYKESMEQRLIKNLLDSNKVRNKELNSIQLEQLNLKRQKKELALKKIENSKNNTHQLNLVSSPFNLQFLPKISPYIKSIDNFLIMDNKKAKKFGAKGFEYIWKQEHLRKLANIKKEEINNKNKKNKRKSEKKEENFINNNNDEDDENNDIFNKHYNLENKKCDEFIKLKERLNRIINQNKKVKKRLNIHRTLSLKFKIKKIYYPKYESIERHQPEIRLNNKTRRIFPDNLFKKTYYSENDKQSQTINNKNIKEKKNENLRFKRRTFYICSSLSFNNNTFTQNTNNIYGQNNISEEKINPKLDNIKFDFNQGNKLLSRNLIKQN